ncbi:cytochrome-c peroxidase [Terriglobus tenax]|uniref:cytochrome-c peroxidase n=1 Tax=Terriglobus tenax TaxID=1111115 RepID=UPI0021DF84DD|nr:cytochrome c peroxidase [Terriglobus tenax]
MPFSRTSIAGLLLLPLLMAGCRSRIQDNPIGKPITIKPPLGLPAVPVPADNPVTAEGIALGRKLFYDKRLSSDNSLACAHCHDPKFYFTDGLRLSKGVKEQLGVRNAPTILNAAYMPFQFWDGRAISLEQQSIGPIANPVEMNNKTHDIFLGKLKGDPEYATLFRKAYGSKDINLLRVEKALASFERTLLSGGSAFDRFQYGGDSTALTPEQLRGLVVFMNPAAGNCAACHTLGSKDSLFTDGKFHNIGQGVKDEGDFNDVGRYHETKVETDKGAFKTPTLRNVAQTAPYMHDGSIKTLPEVVDFYAGQGNSNPYLDPEIRKIHLSPQDRRDLVEFLNALTGEMPPNSGPPAK